MIKSSSRVAINDKAVVGEMLVMPIRDSQVGEWWTGNSMSNSGSSCNGAQEEQQMAAYELVALSELWVMKG